MFLNLTIFQLHHEWSDFYPSDDTEPSNENTNKKNFTNSQHLQLETDSYVVNCYFYSITYSGDGAAIFLLKEYGHFLVEFSTFVECSTIDGYSGGGLGIYCVDFAMNYVCAIECNSSDGCSFTFVDAPGRTINSIYHSSIAYCFAQNDYTMCHAYGFIDVQSVNLSHNTAIEQSSLTCAPVSTKNIDNNDIGASISYSLFSNNNATSQDCLYLDRAKTELQVNEYLIRNSNIIRNKGSNTIRNYQGTLTMTECTVMENEGSPVFCGSITFHKCTVLEDQYNSTTNIHIEEVTTNSFINLLKFPSTGDCIIQFESLHTKSFIDIAGTCQYDNYIPIITHYLFQHLEFIFLLSSLPVC